MPATHLINVDLPAPLSPTSAITSPSRTSKSTSCSACTDPKLFETPRSSSVVAGVAFTERFLPRWRRSEERLHREGLLLAVLRVLADADLAPLQEAFGEEKLVVRLRDPDRRQQDRLRAADLAVDTRHPLPLDDRDRGACCRVRLLADGLVDRSCLPAGEDELDAGRRRVLAGERDLAEPLRLEGGD